MSIFSKFTNMIYRITKILVLIFFITTIISSFSQVIARYVFIQPFRWTEELARYAFIWMSFLGASMAFKDNTNISIDTIATRLPKKIVYWGDLLFQLLIIFFLAILIRGSYEHIVKLGFRISVGLQIQMKYLYAAILTSFSLMIIYTIEIIINKIKELNQTRLKEGH